MNSDPQNSEQENENMSENDSVEENDPLAPEPLLPNVEDETGDATEIEALEDELAKTKDQLLRTVAEMDNIRKRSRKERDDASKYAVSSFARDMLTIADNLRRALDAVPDDIIDSEPRIKNVVEGVEATERELIRNFEKHGIQKVEPGEEIFDPNQHEVMLEIPGSGKPAGMILQVMEVGYMLNDRLLRPARVGVAKDEGGQDSNQPPQGAGPGGTIDTEA